MKIKSPKSFFDKELKRDEENRVIIDMNVKCDDDFLSVYSSSTIPTVNTEVAEFIENNAEPIPPHEPISLRIHGKTIDDGEKIIYEKAIRTYYKEKFDKNKKELHRNNIISSLLLFFGILVLALAIFVDYVFESAIWAEVIDIFAWVLIWEAADTLLFKSHALRTKKIKYSSFIDMKISFYNG